MRSGRGSGRRSSVERNGEHDRPLRLDGDELKLVSVKVDGRSRHGGWTAPTLVIEISRRPRDDRDRSRDRARRQHQADGPLCVERDALHAVRGRRLPPHHLLPRPARRAVANIASGWKATPAASRCCCRTATASLRAKRRTAATGPSGRTRSPSPAICSRWLPATSRPTATASRR